MDAQELALGRIRDSEADLVRAAQTFSADAWREIYRRHHRRMYHYLYARLGDRATAEELASEVFLRACRGIHGYSYRGVPFVSWLYRIADNLAMDFLARRRIKLKPLHEAASATGQDDFAAVDLRLALTTALNKLTLDQRRVVILRFVGGMSLADTAAAMGRRAESIKGLQHRAVASLRRHLARDGIRHG